jgi:hypothetical protein
MASYGTLLESSKSLRSAELLVLECSTEARTGSYELMQRRHFVGLTEMPQIVMKNLLEARIKVNGHLADS